MATGVGCLLLVPTAAVSAPVTVDEDAARSGASTALHDGTDEIAAAGTSPFRVATSSSSSVTRPVLTGRAAGDDIPAPARRAYQRAAVVMADVAPRCRIAWTLVAAVGRVESDHGRRGAAALGPKGVARPHIFGPVLDGRGARARIEDTDNGVLDRNRRWDRAVGPMQFIPSTWSAVGVDADGDGTRSVHDLDDAALAASVYLCADSTDLTRPAAMRQALLRYNKSRAYVALVRAYERSYRTDELASMAPVATAVAMPPSAADARHLATAKRLVAKVDRRPDRRGAATTRREQEPPRPTTKPSAGPSMTPVSRPTTTPAPRPTGTTTATSKTPSAGTGSSSPAAPTPAATPTMVTLTGVWASCGTDCYSVGGSVLDLGALSLSAPAVGDLDGDGAVEDNASELLGLVGSSVQVVGLPRATGLVVLTINGVSLQGS